MQTPVRQCRMRQIKWPSIPTDGYTLINDLREHTRAQETRGLLSGGDQTKQISEKRDAWAGKMVCIRLFPMAIQRQCSGLGDELVADWRASMDDTTLG